LARSRQSGWLALADEQGVTLWEGPTRHRAVLPAVSDLAFDAEGVLWIASADGLHRWALPGRPAPRSLGPSDAANRIHRVVSMDSGLLLATDSGAYWSTRGRIFQPLRVTSTATAATRVALRAPEPASGSTSGIASRPERAQAWVWGGGRLSRVRGLVSESGLRVTDVRHFPPPRATLEREPVDLLIDPSGTRLLLVYPDLVAWRLLSSAEAVSQGGPEWQVVRPVLPPGSTIRRMGWAAGRVWLATDHGMLESEALEGPYRRATHPAGTADCVDLTGAKAEGVWALCRRGLLAFETGSQPLAPMSEGAVAAPGLPADPPLAEIRRRALLRAGLMAERAEGLRRGLARRAYWPELSLRLATEIDQDDRQNRDQTFVSGDTRHLRDRTRDDARRFEAAVVLDWDLGGIAYPLESVDLSRELRQVVSLRDDVADEINQLYFERQGIRERLSGVSLSDPAEAARLRLRAREIDAGLDAWTGGWLSRWRADRAERGDRLEASAPSLGAARSPVAISGPDHPIERKKK